MVSRTLACQVSPGEVWAALEVDGELIGLRIARDGDADIVGGVFLGRIVALRPELPAALVDIGVDRPGFLDGRDIDRKRGIAGLTEGQTLIVEVAKAARADKAAGLRVLRASDARREAFETAARSATVPARMGLARQIVDLVATGSTLRANGLVEIEHIADITSRFIVNRTALKTRAAEVNGWIERFREAADAA